MTVFVKERKHFFLNQLLELIYNFSETIHRVWASIHVLLWLSSVRGRPADLCFRRPITSGVDYKEALQEAAASWPAAGPAGDGPGGAHNAAAMAAVVP